MEVVYLFIGFAAGAAISVFVYLGSQKKLRRKQEDLSAMEKEYLSASAGRDKELGILGDRLINQEQENRNLNELITAEREKSGRFSTENARLQTENSFLAKKLEEQKNELEQLQARLKTEFENLAGQILKRNTEDLSNYNRERIEEVLKPFREKLLQLENSVTKTYEKSLKDTTALQTEVKQLYELSRKLGEEASNLTRALKGDVKKQGNWGEVILERILERSGLRRGSEYEIQSSATDSEGKMVRPDVIIHLPDNKHIIIDSKVSLVAYEKLVNCDSEDEKKQLNKAHVDSVYSHIKNLAGKHYHTLEKLNSPDFVLLFIPIESSFSLAVQQDNDLFSYAWDNKIVIVSPSTLLATLMTVASTWRQENQSRNILEIAQQASKLYDKFVAFLEPMEKIEKYLDAALRAYSDAMNRMKTGSGNLISNVEKIRKLGVKTHKTIPEKYTGETGEIPYKEPDEQV